MRWRDVALVGGAVGTTMLVYGAMVEAKRLVVERHTLRLPKWPERLEGFRIAMLGDLHLRGGVSVDLAREAVLLALAEEPDMVVLVGDIVEDWKRADPVMVENVLEPLLLMDGSAVAVPGNHDYRGNILDLARVFDRLNIRFLRNEAWTHLGISWVGVDSANVGMADPFRACKGIDHDPAICLWHEPDLVGWLPDICALQLSGHSHGGQFRFPGGFTPMHTRNGQRYPRGWYPHAPTPLYVTRGVGTTGPPSRFLCPPEVSILTLMPA